MANLSPYIFNIFLCITIFVIVSSFEKVERLLINDGDYTETQLHQLEVRLQQLTAEYNSLQTKQTLMEQDIQHKLSNMTERVRQLETEVEKSRHHVAFYATLSGHHNLGQEQTVEFDRVITNIGNCYSGITGVFTVPFNGTYHFSTTMFSDGNGEVHAQLMQNSLEIGRNFGNGHMSSGTINVLVSASKGDLIFVRHRTGHNSQTIYGDSFSMFSGFHLG